MNTKQAVEIIEGSLVAEKYLTANGVNCEPLIMAHETALQALQEKEEREHPKRLTIEELNEMDNPVWVSCKTWDGKDGYWCYCNKGIIICPSRQSFRAEEIPSWKFYRHKPKGE